MALRTSTVRKEYIQSDSDGEDAKYLTGRELALGKEDMENDDGKHVT